MINKVLIKNVALVASGALCGALGAYYATKRVLSKEFEKDIKNETCALEKKVKWLEDWSDELCAKIAVYEKAGLSFETAQVIAAKNIAAEKKAEEKLKIAHIDDLRSSYVTYSKAFGEDGKVEKDGVVIEDPAIFDMSEKDEDEPYPYLISNDSFAEDHEEYRKVTCTLYMDDTVLCESSHNEIIDISNVGKENIEFFKNNDIDLLYIRNDNLGIDYEIDKYEGSYTYEVLGKESLEE